MNKENKQLSALELKYQKWVSYESVLFQFLILLLAGTWAYDFFRDKADWNIGAKVLLSAFLIILVTVLFLLFEMKLDTIMREIMEL